MGLVDRGQAGGVFAAERSMIQGLAALGNIEIGSFAFGSRESSAPLWNRAIRLAGDLIRFAGTVLRVRPDVIHLNSAYNRYGLCRDVLYLLIAKASRRRVFLKYHGSDAHLLAEGGGVWRGLTRVVVALSARVGLLSTEELRNFVAAGFPAGKFSVVKNAVDVDRFRSAPPTDRTEGLLFIARFIRPKGLVDLLDAVALLRERGRPVSLVCVGDGPQMAEARERTRALGLGDCVAFTGLLPEDETIRHYLAASILVLPTYHQEGFPMTILHGMAAGMAVVTTRIRAAADYLREPENCIWAYPRQPAALADSLERLLSNPSLCLQMGDRNRLRAGDFSGAVVASEYEKLYRSIAARP